MAALQPRSPASFKEDVGISPKEARTIVKDLLKNSAEEDFFSFVFLDDSNIWIEAKKRGPANDSQDGTDKRVRISLKGLLNLVGQRNPTVGFLYGSRPPANDRVWEAARKRNFRVRVSERAYNEATSRYTTEKEVDTSLVTDASTMVSAVDAVADFMADDNEEVRARICARFRFCIISGDRDMMPAVQVALAAGCPVTMWGWTGCMSRGYVDSANARDRHTRNLSVEFLDAHVKSFTFVSFRSTRKVAVSKVDPRSSVMFILPAKPDAADCKASVDAVLNEAAKDLGYTLLAHVGHFTFYVQAMASPSGDIVVIATFPEQCRMHKMDEVLAEMQRLRNNNLVPPFEHFVTARDRIFGCGTPSPDGFADATMYEELDDDEGVDITLPGAAALARSARRGQDDHKSAPGPVTDGDGYVAVSYKSNERARRTRRARRACPHGVRCRYQSECRFTHTKWEDDMFRRYGGDKKRIYWKSRMCRHPYSHLPRDCAYAHTKEELWCSVCKKTGHNREECPQAGTQLPRRRG